VWLSFDDGYADFKGLAAPVMRRHGQPAAVYVPTGHVGGTAAWLSEPGLGDGDVPLLDWDSIRRLHRAGFTIGAHGVTHRRLTDVDDGELATELRGARDTLEEQLDAEVRHLAYRTGLTTSACGWPPAPRDT
jgi:peptidoglycan/xylan/chitin deacetylase (PgdA/CDA1 family)